PKVIPVEIPVGEGSEFHGIINLFSKRAHLYKKGTKLGEYDEVDVPAEYADRFAKYSQELIESIAATDDTLLERYLGGVEITRDEAIAAMKVGMLKGELFPLFCGAAELTYGTRALLTKLVELCPAPQDRPAVEAQRWGSAERHTLTAGDAGPLAAQVFKTVSEPHVGDVTLFRIVSGSVKSGQDVWNAPRDAAEKLNHLCVAVGKERIEIAELHAGDIGVVAKLRDTHTNDTLSTRDMPLVLPKIPFPEPVISVAVEVKQRGEEDKLSTGLHKLHEEDPTFHHEYNAELGQTLVRGLGERHLEIVVGRLARKFGVHAQTAKPRVAYRETFRGKAEGQGKHKKQTGGRGQYGDCWIRIAPLPRGSGVQFVDEIVGGVIPRQYIPAVERGVVEAAAKGPVAGYPVVDFQVELYDGSYHDVDSNEMSFKMAGILAFRNVSPGARPVLLEPIMEVEVWTPDDYQGAVMGDISSRRGHIVGTEKDGRLTKVKALVPEAELDRYATTLHSITHGRGTYRMKFHVYQDAPPDVAAKVTEARKKELEGAKA
ncbi:MAG: elongation factor G, partial [Gemmatimonadales bacterium]